MKRLRPFGREVNMKRRILVIVCLMALVSAIGTARSASDTDVPSRDDILRLLDLLQVRARMVQVMDGMKTAMKAGAEAGLKKQLPSATPAQLAKVDVMAETVFDDLPVDELLDAMIPIYQRHLTKSDVDAVVAFYTSPAGQHLLKEQPAMTAEGMKAGQDIMLKKVPELTQKLNMQVAQLAKEAQRDPSAPTSK
jgi:hypothetical protein